MAGLRKCAKGQCIHFFHQNDNIFLLKGKLTNNHALVLYWFGVMTAYGLEDN